MTPGLTMRAPHDDRAHRGRPGRRGARGRLARRSVMHRHRHGPRVTLAARRGCRAVDNKAKVRRLVRVLNHLRDQYEELFALCEEFDRQEDERLWQRWGRRWESERRALRFLEARN